MKYAVREFNFFFIIRWMNDELISNYETGRNIESQRRKKHYTEIGYHESERRFCKYFKIVLKNKAAMISSKTGFLILFFLATNRRKLRYNGWMIINGTHWRWQPLKLPVDFAVTEASVTLKKTGKDLPMIVRRILYTHRLFRLQRWDTQV